MRLFFSHPLSLLHVYVYMCTYTYAQRYLYSYVKYIIHAHIYIHLCIGRERERERERASRLGIYIPVFKIRLNLSIVACQRLPHCHIDWLLTQGSSHSNYHMQEPPQIANTVFS